MAKSPEEMAASMIANLKEKTGRSLEEWLVVTSKTGLQKHGLLVKHLKGEHGVTHGFANLIAIKSLEVGKPAATGDDLVDSQYAGPKADLRPIYDDLMAKISKFGTDLDISPKKAYVSLRRGKQFAIVQPSTRTRVDVGLNLKAVEPTDRLEISGSFNAMVSHRVRLTSAEQVDDELLGWLRAAYDRA